MGFTFDPPSSDATPPYKPNPQKSRVPKLSSKAPTASVTSSNSFLDHLFHRVRNPFHHSSNSARAKSKSAINPAPSQLSNRAPSADPLFFRLPLELREAIYRLVVAHHETLHILMKRRPNGLSHPLVHRRCQAGGDLNGCILHDCKRFLAAEGGQGCYFGSFATVSGLLYTCRDIYQEVSDLLYTQNTFEFDHPMTLGLFKKTLHPSSLNSIKSISINLQKGLYYPLTPTQAYTHLRDWQDMWTIISAMEGLEEIRVRFQFPAKWSFMSPEKEMLASLWQVNRPMRVFEVDTGGAIFFNFEQTADAPFKLLRHEA
ncbi:hypothetical protein V8E51_003749 [Hyaloscypha variabilis]